MLRAQGRDLRGKGSRKGARTSRRKGSRKPKSAQRPASKVSQLTLEDRRRNARSKRERASAWDGAALTGKAYLKRELKLYFGGLIGLTIIMFLAALLLPITGSAFGLTSKSWLLIRASSLAILAVFGNLLKAYWHFIETGSTRVHSFLVLAFLDAALASFCIACLVLGKVYETTAGIVILSITVLLFLVTTKQMIDLCRWATNGGAKRIGKGISMASPRPPRQAPSTAAPVKTAQMRAAAPRRTVKAANSMMMMMMMMMISPHESWAEKKKKKKKKKRKTT